MNDFHKAKSGEDRIMKKTRWALVLGGSKGLGFATVRKLGENGYSILAVHRDRKTDLTVLDKNFESLRAGGVVVHNFNADALNNQSRNELIAQIEKIIPAGEKISVLVHSIAKGHLKPMLAGKGDPLEGADLQ
ncbi:MAG: SDR family oxidoreductase, partial [Flavobacteriaceae bacterium]